MQDDVDLVRRAACRWSAGVREAPCAAELLLRARDARFLLFGEATHGTYEFYRQRADLTKRLVEEGALHAVVVEAGFPDAYRVHRYVTGRSDDRDAAAALAGFERFPQWMWRNEVVVDFVEWLRAHNARLAPDAKVGFHGMDLYSLYTSIEAILSHLDRADPDAAARARERYACFEPFAGDSERYGYEATIGTTSCEDEAVAELLELQERTAAVVGRDGHTSEEDAFFVEQNARLVKNAEAYYRTMFRGSVRSWNVRDEHMAETVEALDAFLGRRIRHPRIAVWAHNSHLGDARATAMGDVGERNVGQLLRERHPRTCFLVGFTTYDGTVTAASDWDLPAETMTMNAALDDSYEALFHATGLGELVVYPRDLEALRARRLERAIGVVYRPRTERASHWFPASLGEQFDAVVHLDRTRALAPLERAPLEHGHEAFETYPSAL